MTQAPVADARTYSAAALAVTGLALWALQTYVFRSHSVPSAVTADAYVIIPAIVGYIAAHITRLYTRPVPPRPAPPSPPQPGPSDGGGGGGGTWSTGGGSGGELTQVTVT